MQIDDWFCGLIKLISASYLLLFEKLGKYLYSNDFSLLNEKGDYESKIWDEYFSIKNELTL